jgi:uncharacterized protein (TIGR03435 family)
MTSHIAGALLLFASVAYAQQPAFDAASVKIGGPDFTPGVNFQMKGGPGTADPGRITYTHVNLRALLMKAFDVKFDQIAGQPWMREGHVEDSYTITATMPPDTTKENFQLMLQNLLIERFQMKLHHETRNFPGYELSVAPGGPKLKPTEQDPSAVSPVASGIPTKPQFNPDGSFKFPPGPQTAVRFGKGEEHAQFQARSIADLASQLGSSLNQALNADPGAPQPRVIDKTGLTSKYDFTLEFDCPGCIGLTAAMRANMPLLADRGGAEAPPADATQDPGSGLPNIFNALEKQLGLKLVRVKDVPVDVIVIDHAEKVPLEN